MKLQIWEDGRWKNTFSTAQPGMHSDFIYWLNLGLIVWFKDVDHAYRKWKPK